MAAAKAKPKAPTPAPVPTTSKGPVTTTESNEEMEELKSVVSSMVAEVAYQPESEELEVVFANGHEESYPASQDQYEELLATASIGKYMWENFLG